MPNFDTIYEALRKLDEADGDKTKGSISSDTIFNFLSSPQHLASSLRNGVIYAAQFNEDKSSSKFDPIANILKNETDTPYSHVCFTKHTQKVSMQLNRPFGIGFRRDKFLQLVKYTNNGCLFSYDQFKYST